MTLQQRVNLFDEAIDPLRLSGAAALGEGLEFVVAVDLLRLQSLQVGVVEVERFERDRDRPLARRARVLSVDEDRQLVARDVIADEEVVAEREYAQVAALQGGLNLAVPVLADDDVLVAPRLEAVARRVGERGLELLEQRQRLLVRMRVAEEPANDGLAVGCPFAQCQPGFGVERKTPVVGDQSRLDASEFLGGVADVEQGFALEPDQPPLAAERLGAGDLKTDVELLLGGEFVEFFAQAVEGAVPAVARVAGAGENSVEH